MLKLTYSKLMESNKQNCLTNTTIDPYLQWYNWYIILAKVYNVFFLQFWCPCHWSLPLLCSFTQTLIFSRLIVRLKSKHPNENLLSSLAFAIRNCKNLIQLGRWVNTFPFCFLHKMLLLMMHITAWLSTMYDLNCKLATEDLGKPIVLVAPWKALGSCGIPADLLPLQVMLSTPTLWQFSQVQCH